MAAGVGLFLLADAGFCRTLGISHGPWRVLAAGLALLSIPLGVGLSAMAQLAGLVALPVLLARGRDISPVTDTPYVPRSRSREATFQVNIADWDELRREVVRLARLVAADVAKEERPAVRVVVKVRFAPFITRTHGQKLAAPASDPALIEEAALAALARFTEGRPVRLLGVRAEFAD